MKFGKSQGGFSEAPTGAEDTSSPRKRRELLHTRTEVQSVAGRTQEIREGAIEDIALPLGSESFKKELYALTTVVTESIYPKVAEIKAKNEGSIAWYQPPKGVELGFITASELHSRMQKDPLRTFMQIRNSFGALFQMGFEEWMTSVKADVASGNTGAIDVRALGRTQKILGEMNHPDATVWRFLRSGGNTAGIVSGDIAVAGPIAFYEKTGRVPTPVEYRELMQSGRALVMDIASMHVYNMANLIERMIKEPSVDALSRWGTDYDQVLFPAEFFSVSDTVDSDGSKHWKLDFEPSLLRTWSAEVPESRPMSRLFTADADVARLGCPARGAMVVDAEGKKANVVDQAFAHTLAVAEEFLVPHMKEFVAETVRIRDEYVARQNEV